MNDQTAAPPPSEHAASEPPSDFVRRALWFAGIAGVCALVAYGIVRASAGPAPSDPTSERIQSLIDEANRLLRTLDDKKRG